MYDSFIYILLCVLHYTYYYCNFNLFPKATIFIHFQSVPFSSSFLLSLRKINKNPWHINETQKKAFHNLRTPRGYPVARLWETEAVHRSNRNRQRFEQKIEGSRMKYRTSVCSLRAEAKTKTNRAAPDRISEGKVQDPQMARDPVREGNPNTVQVRWHRLCMLYSFAAIYTSSEKTILRYRI